MYFLQIKFWQPTIFEPFDMKKVEYVFWKPKKEKNDLIFENMGRGQKNGGPCRKVHVSFAEGEKCKNR